VSTVIVTGGASGLGAALMRRLGDRGVCLDLQEPAVGADHEVVDLADGRAAEAAVERVASRRGGIDAVVTAAGVDSPGKLEDVPAETWERVVVVNLIGTAAVVRAALPHLERSRGRVVTVASTLGMRALRDACA
jgi:NAD(P)-dependent dehydrogenase (short-subunit alcohol dehydrogenase family)